MVNIIKKCGLLTAVFIFFLQFLLPLTAFAARPSTELKTPSGIAANATNPGDQTPLEWPNFKFKFIDRATIVVSIPGGSDRIIESSTNSTTFNEVMGGTFVRNKHNSEDYKMSNRGNITLFELRAGNEYYEKTKEGSYATRWRNLTEEQIKSIAGDLAFRITTLSNNANHESELYPLGTNVCSGIDEDQFVGVKLSSSGDKAEWNCSDSQDGAASWIDLKQDNLDGNALNFNITHIANSDATELNVVFPGNDEEKDSFVYCEGTDNYALEDCKNPRDGYVIDMPKSTFEGSGTVDVSVTSDKKDDFDIVISQNNNPDSQLSGGGESGGGTSADDDNSCESRGGAMGWIMCPVIYAIDEGTQWADNQIGRLLEIDSDYYTDGRLRDSFGVIRNLAYIILVPMMLIMAIGTAMGFNFISAYTVKKALPRLAIAVIFIALSFDLLVFLIEFSNIVGRGVLGLLTGPFSTDLDSMTLQELMGGSLFTSIFAAPFVTIGLLIVLWLFGGTLLLFAAIAFLVLFIRQIFIIALLLVAPLAILAWIFPGNDKLWNGWWGVFSKLLMMYPLIMAVIAMGRIFAFIIDSKNAAGFEGMVIEPLMIIMAWLIPYAFIPFTFKFAGGVFGTVTGALNDRSKGFFDKQRQKRAGKVGRMRNYSAMSDRNKVTRGINTALGAATRPRDLIRGRKGIQAGRQTGRILQGQEALKNDATYQAHQNDDQFLLALANEGLAQQRINNARDRMNDETLSDEKRSAAEAEYHARQSAMDNAKRVTSRKSSGTRLAALNQLAKTGYQFSAGGVGYDELSSTVADIAGPVGSGAYNTAMNEAQYHLKSAGRGDLGGINNGDVSSVRDGIKSGVRKLGNYGRGQGKTDQYHGAAQAWLGSDAVGDNGKTHADTERVARGIERSLASGETSFEDLSEYQGMLLRDLSSATDANKIEIQKQLDSMELVRGTDPGSPGIGDQLAEQRQTFYEQQQNGGMPDAERTENK